MNISGNRHSINTDLDSRHRDLASNLVGIANQGQNSFIEAHGDMFQTATKTNNMGRVGGIVKQAFAGPNVRKLMCVPRSTRF